EQTDIPSSLRQPLIHLSLLYYRFTEVSTYKSCTFFYTFFIPEDNVREKKTDYNKYNLNKLKGEEDEEKADFLCSRNSVFISIYDGMQ
ncbi:MAG: hypothetical protein WCS17_14265, partial [Prevotella sp.]